MAYAKLLLHIGVLVTVVQGQETLTANPEHSAIPEPYPNPYQYPNHNNSWIQKHNETWFNASEPNSPWSNATDANGNFEAAYYPGRAPAIPLAVRSPYTSAWASTANNGSLNSQYPIFWDGSALGWEGIVTVDGISYEWMGIGSRSLPQLSNFIPAAPISTSYDSSYSNFTFAAGPIELTASFLSPVIPRDLCRTSIPLSYLSVSVVSRDGGAHNVSLYTDVNGGWVTQPAAPLTWKMYESGSPVNGSNATSSSTSNSLYTWIVQLQDQYEFGENPGQDGNRAAQGVFPQWGNFTWSSTQGSAQSIRFQSGFSVNQRFHYVMGQSLDNIVDDAYRSYTEQEPVFAFEHGLGEVGSTPTTPVVFTIGNVEQPAVRFLSSVGIESLDPWWATPSCYGDVFSMIQFHYDDLPQAQSLAAQFETKLKNDINTYYGNPDNATTTSGQADPPISPSNGTDGQSMTGTDQFGNQYIFNSDNAYGWLEPSDGCVSNGVAVPDISEQESYYAITALAARQILAAYVLTNNSRASSSGCSLMSPSNTSEPFAFQKEISSNGNTNTIDVIFPAMPFFLWINPDFLRYVLAPNYMNQENNFYPNAYSMHDLGSRFPNATGHVEGDDEYMPVEESGNMIIMAYAIYRLGNSLSHLQEHYAILKQWAQYLIEYTLIPAIQLSTDDFAGQLANQTNLAIKGIVGLAAMAEISNAVGDTAQALNYSTTAQEYYGNWTQYAIDPSGKHTVLAYQWRSSWGLLYNTYPARLLNLSIIPDSLFKMQSDFYPSVSQMWGVPLDSRHHWTKSDWEMWTAATCEPATRRLFVDAIAYWLNTTSSDRPFTDLYQTVHEGESPENPDQIEFFARPVQGGLYSLLALVAAGTYA
ncbi:hypothetical protein PMZ80_003577 [Knufia obscura]|uniref:Glutaminase n=2 Tax=Knufia TaxID=430999 RepID=A0AAN8IST7_9EURO|nr:hypothetical protein PMZ80_003577 [Knufia obscura]KAK5958507.1 hypothetical protein OHC33_000350 [Knufia fluminis]